MTSVAGSSGLGNFGVLPKGVSFGDPCCKAVPELGERVVVTLSKFDAGSVIDVANGVRDSGMFESVDASGVGLIEVGKFGESECSMDTTVCSGLSFSSTGLTGLVRSGTSWPHPKRLLWHC